MVEGKMNRVIACLWKGDKSLPEYSRGQYDEGYVARLLEGVERCVPDGELTMLVDDWGYKVVEQWHIRGLLRAVKFDTVADGWWRMTEAFRPDLRPKEGERNLLVGLDTVFTGDCQWLFDWDKSPVGLPIDPYHRHEVCNGVVSYDREGAGIVWAASSQPEKHIFCGAPSEMALLRTLYNVNGWETLEVVPDLLLSYKVHIQKELRNPEGASIVYFHGLPKPHQIPEDDAVRRIWDDAGL